MAPAPPFAADRAVAWMASAIGNCRYAD